MTTSIDSRQVTDNTVAFSPDGDALLVSNTEPATGFNIFMAWTQLVRVTDGSVLRDFGKTLPRRPTFSPDGTWIAAGAQLVHLATMTLARLDQSIVVSAFLPDGRIAAADEDNLVRLFCPSAVAKGSPTMPTPAKFSRARPLRLP
jgi:hypothetical protein